MDVPTPETAPPLAVDIDGTLTDEHRVIDPRAAAVLQRWPAPVAIATGKAFPYPVALCEFLGLDPAVIAENGGVVLAGRDGPLRFTGDPEAAAAVAADLEAQAPGLGWGEVDLVNRWRETELAVSREVPREVVEAAAETAGLVVLDTGFAYHVVSPSVSKGSGLETLAAELGRDPIEFVAVGDSENDVSLFNVVTRAVAVGSADNPAKAAADHVTDDGYADGFLEGIRWLLG
ncbi:MAG: phosphoglycolate phosphatase [Salinirussus sp.]